MAMINYADKVALNSNSGIADINKCNATDMNEIKSALNNYVQTGWYSGQSGSVYSFVSWDASVRTGVIASSLDVTGLLSVGMKVKFTQSATVKFGIITAITSTQITLFMGTDYTLTNAPISDTFYSIVKAPYGFPMNPDKWSVTVSAPLSQANVTVNTYYASGTTLSVPIGAWEIFWSSVVTIHGSSAAQAMGSTSLSTSTSSHSDSTMVSAVIGYIYTNTAEFASSISKNKVYTLANKTTFYIVGVITQTAGTTEFFSSNYIRATCAYL